MKPIYIYKNLRGGPVAVARIDLSEAGARIESSEKTVIRILNLALARPAAESQWQGLSLTKRMPQDMDDQVVARLKRHLPRPYFASWTPAEGLGQEN